MVKLSLIDFGEFVRSWLIMEVEGNAFFMSQIAIIFARFKF